MGGAHHLLFGCHITVGNMAPAFCMCLLVFSVHFGVFIVVRVVVFIVGGVLAMVSLWCSVACHGGLVGGWLSG